ncbi:sterol-4alpha-carboxylate 3-dehydrogenase (decarboxylating) [Klebsormidium nitens]|uniref:Sterol-4alpha-carboxylate 3-dehydrogenase (Decarboxylating) n=1 Tax=Klebsormidium nitens TaxID=105231 RepID=A0A1Y1HSI5_KLENI|nr:sterol-4alpha-carboxylate 3-dehydrogenase (decarboxylating) [Klebsormidium nitens]|eukprot:GAQ81590.1 sterol-4alpha-carboxylate 3-dehydrogenase (decarboxylating) [Klebsormidium nitens]
MSTMKVFVTGASGFIGTQLTPFLRYHGDSVVALSRSSAADEKIRKASDVVPTKGLPPNGKRPEVGTVEIVRGDLTAEDVLKKGMQGCDVVIHAAAKIDGWGPYSDFQKITVEGTRNTLAAARAAGVAQFVFISSEAVLVKADGSIGSVDETTPVDPPPWAPYSRSKAEAEKLVLQANSPPDFETVVVRPRFVWGRGDSVMRPTLTQQFNDGSWRWITPLAVSSTSHVINVCHALRLAAQARGRGGQVYFVTDGPPRLLKDFLLQYVASQPGVKQPTATVPFWLLWYRESALENVPLLGYGVTREPLIGRQDLALIGRDVRIDDSKIRRELGYEPVVSVEEGVEDANA